MDTCLLSRRYLLGRPLRALESWSSSPLLVPPSLGLSTLLSRRLNSLLGPLSNPLLWECLRSRLLGLPLSLRSPLLWECLRSRLLGLLPLPSESLLLRLRGAPW